MELDSLLNEDIVSARERESSAFERMAGPLTGSLILFGAGILGRKILAGLRKKGIEPLAFSDNDTGKWGRSIDGIKVLSPVEAAGKFSDSACFVVTIWSPNNNCLQIRNQLQKLGCSKIVHFVVLFWKYPDIFLPYYLFDLPSKILEQDSFIRKALALLNDEESRRQYVSHLRWRLLSDYEGLPPASLRDQYFPDIVRLLPDEVFVDCGAFDGDTIDRFIKMEDGKFKDIIAYEPDLRNFRKLREYIMTLDRPIRDKIRISNHAVGSRQMKACFDSAGEARSAVSNTGSVIVDCVTLDEDLISDGPTFLKFDIEGSEMDGLIGANHIIKDHMPVVAVCVYHRPDDLWQIPLYLHSINSDYKFFIRTHQFDGLDTVLYAMSPDRASSCTE
jgi:FkbM family methyltransferase